MLAAYAAAQDFNDPLSGLEVGEQPEPTVPAGWTTVEMRAASLNHHDLWSLRGIGLPSDRLPMILGCDGAGVDADGRSVLIYPVIANAAAGGGDETMDSRRTILSELHQGTLAERITVPRRQLVPLPQGWTFAQAACLPTAWLTAYRMLAIRGGLVPGNTVLVQGAGGGVATACIVLGKAMGLRVWATSRDESKRERALSIGAAQAFSVGERLPERVDSVMETVGAATWEHSVKSLRAGGTLVVSGATSGPNPPALLAHVFFRQLNIVGSTMGTLDDLKHLLSLCSVQGVRPIIHQQFPLREAEAAFAALEAGDVFGKIVITNE